MAGVSSAKPILVSEYRDILLAHEKEYCLAKGTSRQDIVAEIIEEITSQGKGKLREDAMKGLDSVSQFFYHGMQRSHPLGLRKYKLGTITTRLSQWRMNPLLFLLVQSGTTGW
jgi:hypothetical protein